MPWWFIIPAAVAATRIILGHLQEHKPGSGLSNAPTVALPLEVRGSTEGRKIIFVGRTGAGKSSLINAIKGLPVLQVGDVGSTTRWLEGIEVSVLGRRLLLIDSPGIGEAQTHEDYANAIALWCRVYRESIKGFVLVVQADSKGHSEDKLFLEALLREVSDARILIVLSQADKVKPSREPFVTNSWSSESRLNNSKSANILEKIRIIEEQFGLPATAIVPVAAEGGAVVFNLESFRLGLLSFLS